MALVSTRPQPDKQEHSEEVPYVRVVKPAAEKRSRAQRFADAHAWVLEHHAATFEKLAK